MEEEDCSRSYRASLFENCTRAFNRLVCHLSSHVSEPKEGCYFLFYMQHTGICVNQMEGKVNCVFNWEMYSADHFSKLNMKVKVLPVKKISAYPDC